MFDQINAALMIIRDQPQTFEL